MCVQTELQNRNLYLKKSHLRIPSSMSGIKVVDQKVGNIGPKKHFVVVRLVEIVLFFCVSKFLCCFLHLECLQDIF